MDFGDFVDRCFSARSMQDKLNLCLNGCNSRGETFVVSVDRNVNVRDAEIDSCNIDAIITKALQYPPIPEGQRMTLYLSPPLQEMIKKIDVGVYNFKKSDFWEDEDVEEDDGDLPVNFNRIPHSLFATSGGLNHNLKHYIFFPEMYLQQQRTTTNIPNRHNRRNRRAYMDVNDQELFVDNFVLPALKDLTEDRSLPSDQRLPLAYFNKLPLSYRQSTQINKFQSVIFNFTTTNFNILFVDKMRQDIEENDMQIFSNFFFVTVSYGGKQLLPSGRAIRKEEIAKNEFDWEQVNASNVTVDFGVNVRFTSDHGKVAFIKKSDVDRYIKYFFGEVSAQKTFYPAALSSNFGTFSGYLIRQSESSYGVSKFLCYTDFRNQFSGLHHGKHNTFRGRGNEDDFYPTTMQNGSETVTSLKVSIRRNKHYAPYCKLINFFIKNYYVARLDESLYSNYTLRFEFRLPVPTFIENMVTIREKVL
jgi:hypothetical protein